MPNSLPTAELINQLPHVRGSYRADANLAKTNWFNVGGNAQILFRPADIDDLSFFMKEKPLDIPVTILGVGSNLLVRDGGIDGVVIKLGRGFTDIQVDGTTITASAAALDYNVANIAAQAGIDGLSFLSGVPGTIGGALAMNAGAYGGDIASVLVSAKAVDEKGDLHVLTPKDIGYIYRGNTLPESMIFVEGTFKGSKADPQVIKKQIEEITAKRQETQPIKERTSGSTFKNPEGKKAWQLIDEAGCRGLQIGGAQVSEKHCNFFINTGNATSSDIEELGELVRKKVKEKTGVDLQWEVKIIGKSR